MTSGEISSIESSIPATLLRAFRIMAEDAVSSGEAFPSIILPSGSSAATTGLSVSAILSLTTLTTSRYVTSMPACFIRISDLNRTPSSTRPSLRSLRAAKYLLMISELAAFLTASSSTMQFPAMFTPMSVGDLYTDFPKIPSRMAFTTGKTSTSLL